MTLPLFFRCAVATVLLAACGDEPMPIDTGSPDSGTDTAVPDLGVAIAPPAIPWLDDGEPPLDAPSFTPCPEGWREVEGPHAATCHPYPISGREACPSGEAHFPGEAGCRAIGSPCPSGDYADDLPTDGPLVYVRAGAAPGGAGTISSPYASLSAVPWTSLPTGTIVAIAKGTYPGAIGTGRSIRVFGACAAETILIGQAGVPMGVVTVASGADVLVSDLSIVDPPNAGVQISGARLTLDGVRVDRAKLLGVLANGPGSVLVADDVIIENTQEASADDPFGRGIELENGATFTCTRCFISGNRDAGIFAAGAGSGMTLTDSAIVDTRPEVRNGTDGQGLAAQGGASIDATRVYVGGNLSLGVGGTDPGGSVALTDVVVEGTRSESVGGLGGGGISAIEGTSLRATRTWVHDNRDIGIVYAYRGSTAILEDVVVSDTGSTEGTGEGGVGIAGLEDSTLQARRMVVSGSRLAGVFFQGPRAAGDLTDVRVASVEPQERDGFGGWGIRGQSAAVSLIRGALSTTHASGIEVGPGELTLEDVAIRDVTPSRSRDFCSGVEVTEVTLSANRLLVQRAPGVGVAAANSSTLTLNDVVVVDTAIDDSAFTRGRGINLQQGSSAEISRISIANGGDQGITALSESTIHVRDATVTGGFFGLSGASATLSAESFRVSRAATCGIFVAKIPWIDQDPEVDLMNGLVEGSDIGACIQADEYVVERLQDAVVYQDNATNLDVTMLPVPGVVDPVEEP